MVCSVNHSEVNQLRPVYSGFFAHHFSWRALHISLAFFALAAYICVLFCFPETSYPGSRGVDQYEREGGVHPSWRPIILNPFSQLGMLRSPSILAVVRLARLLTSVHSMLMSFNFISRWAVSWSFSVILVSESALFIRSHLNLTFSAPCAACIYHRE